MSPQCRYGKVGHDCDVPVCAESGMAQQQRRGRPSGILTEKDNVAGPKGSVYVSEAIPAGGSSLLR